MANELIKYKVSDLARDLGLPAKQVIDELAAATGETKKPGANLNKDELNLLMDRLTRTAQEDSLTAYLDTAPKPQPKPSEVLRRADGCVRARRSSSPPPSPPSLPRRPSRPPPPRRTRRATSPPPSPPPRRPRLPRRPPPLSPLRSSASR